MNEWLIAVQFVRYIPVFLNLKHSSLSIYLTPTSVKKYIEISFHTQVQQKTGNIAYVLSSKGFNAKKYAIIRRWTT